MFGTLPAYGFLCRHVKQLKLQNVTLATSSPDRRHAIIFDDVEQGVIESLDAPYAPDAVGMICLKDSSHVFIRNCQPASDTELFLDVRGAQAKNIMLFSNDLSGVENAVLKAADVPESAVVMMANNLSQE